MIGEHIERRHFVTSKKWIILLSIILLLSLFMAIALPRLLFPPQPELAEEAYRKLFPYQSHYVDLDNGTKIHYVDEGEGPTLLLLHGNPTSAFLYRHLIAALKSDYRLVAPDYPGFGRSEAPTGYGFTVQEQAETTVAFFDRLELDNVVVMVQDWGGRSASILLSSDRSVFVALSSAILGLGHLKDRAVTRCSAGSWVGRLDAGSMALTMA